MPRLRMEKCGLTDICWFASMRFTGCGGFEFPALQSCLQYPLVLPALIRSASTPTTNESAPSLRIST